MIISLVVIVTIDDVQISLPTLLTICSEHQMNIHIVDVRIYSRFFLVCQAYSKEFLKLVSGLQKSC